MSNHLSLFDLYAGLPLKLIYNLPVLAGYFYSTQEGYELQSVGAWILAALLYPINTMKVREQVAVTPLSTVTPNTGVILHSFYRGVLPFILLNAFIGYSLRPLFNQARLDKINSDIQEELVTKGFDL